jgi:hypothetical protein
VRHIPGWSEWEGYVNNRLGLQPTIASGSQFHEKGDGFDTSRGDWAFQVDAKYTEKISYAVRGSTFFEWVWQAVSRGRNFALVVRIWPRGQKQPHDLAVIPFDLLVSMVDRLKELESARQEI